jgi:hypothetical protein
MRNDHSGHARWTAIGPLRPVRPGVRLKVGPGRSASHCAGRQRGSRGHQVGGPVQQRLAGHRLHRRGFHRQRPGLRRHLRRGRKRSFSRCKGSLKPGGIYLAADGWQILALALRPARAGAKKVMLAILPRYARQGVVFLSQLIEAGKYQAVIGRRYPLQQVADAARYVETQQKTGNVVLTINGSQAR